MFRILPVCLILMTVLCRTGFLDRGAPAAAMLHFFVSYFHIFIKA
jgi:hypothetical protein